MTVNVEALIHSLGKTYKELVDADLIPYKSKPTGFSGSDVVTLDMVKEGVFLAFHRDTKQFKEFTLTLQDQEKKNWVFPNILTPPLHSQMTRHWIHIEFGEPDKALSPRKRGRREIGWTERYSLVDFHIPVSLQIDYDLSEYARKLTFLPTSELRW